MPNQTSDPNMETPRGIFPATGERLIYVMPQEAIRSLTDDELSLLEVWRILWRGKWTIMVIAAIFCCASIVYALTATEWYRAEVLLAPAEENTEGLTGTLGGLANLAGVNMGGGGSVEALAVLGSRDFTGAFIGDLNLLQFFFADKWDASTGSWIDVDDGDKPDIRDGVKYFGDNVRTITEDPDTGLVTLAIEWTDPKIAAEWANLLVERLNYRMRRQALDEAETNVKYLQEELTKTNVVTLQQSIGRLMESELQKLMLARGNEEFAFRVIDRAQVPKLRARPKRTLIVVLATIIGGMTAVLIVFVRHGLSRPADISTRSG